MPTLLFEDFEIDLDLFALARAGNPVEIGAKPLSVLIYLIENRRRVVSKEDLAEAVWNGASLSAATIPTCILAIRKALGDDATAPRFVSSIRSRGYRFVAKIQRTGDTRPLAKRAFDTEFELVGRSWPLDGLIREAKRVARSRTGSMAEIVGEAGMGKTRLVSEFIKRCPDDLQILQATTPRPGQSAPFSTWEKLLERTNEGEAISRARAIPFAAQEVGMEPDPATVPTAEVSRAATFQRWLERIDAATHRKPAAIVLDDTHRLDPDSCLLLYWLAEALEERPLLLVVARRPHFSMRESEEIFSDIGRLDLCRQERLSPLTSQDVELLVDPCSSEPQEAAEAIVRRSAGIPFYVTHLILSSYRDTSPSGSDIAVRDLAVDAREIVARQISDLPRRTRSALAAAAVLGETLDAQSLSEVLRTTPSETLEFLEPALSAWILEETGEQLRFRHALLREALARTLSSRARKEIHQLRAQALIGRGLATTPQEIAHHLLESLPLSDANAAIGWAVRAGRESEERHAYHEGKRWLTSALRTLDLHPELESEFNRADVLILLGRATLFSGHRTDARKILLAAANNARERGDHHALARTALELAPDFLTIEVGVFDPTLIRLTEEALGSLDETEPTTRSRLYARLASGYRWSPIPANVASFADRSLRLADESGSSTARMEALSAKVDTLGGVRRAPERLRLCKILLKEARRLRSQHTALTCHTRMTSALLELGDIGSIREQHRFQSDLAAEVGLPQYRWLSLATEAMLSDLEGDLAKAESIVAEYVQLARSTGDTNVRLCAAGQTASIHFQRDNPKPIRRVMEELTKEQPEVVFWKSLATWSRFLEGDIAGVKESLGSLSLSELDKLEQEPGGSLGLAVVAEAAAHYGAERDRRMIAEAIDPVVDGFASAGFGVTYFGSMKRYAGLLADSLGDPEGATAHLEDCVTCESARGAIAWNMYAIADLIRVRDTASNDPGREIDAAKTLLASRDSAQLIRARRILRTAVAEAVR